MSKMLRIRAKTQRSPGRVLICEGHFARRARRGAAAPRARTRRRDARSMQAPQRTHTCLRRIASPPTACLRCSSARLCAAARPLRDATASRPPAHAHQRGLDVAAAKRLRAQLIEIRGVRACGALCLAAIARRRRRCRAASHPRPHREVRPPQAVSPGMPVGAASGRCALWVIDCSCGRAVGAV